MAEVDIMAAFENVFSKSNSNYSGSNRREGSFPYSSFNMTNKSNRGKVFGVLIPDKRNIPLRVLKNVSTTWLTSYDEEGNERNMEYKWCDASNYKEGVMTQEDLELHTKVKEELDIYVNNYTGDYSPVKTSSRVTLFYFAITKTVSDESGEVQKYTNPGITLMIHRAASFPQSFNDAMKSKTEGNDDPTWIKEYFNRDNGVHDKIMAISTALKGSGQPGYNIGFVFDRLPNIAANIDESHLAEANDLNKEYIDITEYDREYYKNMLELLKSKNKESDAAQGIVSSPVEEVVKSDVSLVSNPEPKKISGLADLD